MKKRWKRTNFQFWAPSRWDQILGNHRLKKFLQNLVRMYRFSHPSRWKMVRLLVTGPSRTGKTMLLTFFVQCLTCKQLDPETLNPSCGGTCEACRQDVKLNGDRGLWSELEEINAGTYEGERVPIHFVPIDGTAVNQAVMGELLMELQDYDGLRIIFIDEAHRLIKRDCDEKLLKPVEQKDFLWLFSTAEPRPLEEMFMNRLLKEKTELPRPEEAEQWVVDRCEEEGIPYQEEAVVELVEKCECVVGQIMLALTWAAVEPEGLTLALVEAFKLRPE